MRCTRFGTANDADARFCDGCGMSLSTTCPGCATPNRLGGRFCKACGHALSEPSPSPPLSPAQAHTPLYFAEQVLTPRSALEGERKQITALFCDLVNSTGLAERLGPEEFHRLNSYP